jgi:hypothetical protein
MHGQFIMTAPPKLAECPICDGCGWVCEPQTDLFELLALYTAMTVNERPGAGAAFDANALAAAVELGMAGWWEPTPAALLLIGAIMKSMSPT